MKEALTIGYETFRHIRLDSCPPLAYQLNNHVFWLE